MLRLILAAVLAAAVLVAPGHAVDAAADDCRQSYIDADGKIQWRNVCSGQDDGNDDSGGAASCYLGRQQQFGYEVAYCSGELSCYLFIPSRVYPDPSTWPARPAGVSEQATYTNRACFTQPPAEALQVNEYIWYEPTAQDPSSYLTAALASLTLPTVELAANPPGRSVVGIPTWWWADGAGTGRVVGGSAGGLVGIATPARLEVDPGDGSGVMRCAVVVSRSDDCSSTYDRSSVDGTATVEGQPAYTVRMRVVYDLSFTWQGGPITLAGAPATVSTPWASSDRLVLEVQALTVG